MEPLLTSANIVFVARQPGTVNSLKHVARSLRALGNQVAFLVYPVGLPSLGETDIKCSLVVENFDAAKHYFQSKQRHIDLIITGTSEHFADDSFYWKWAEGQGIKAVAFVDQWSGILERFGWPAPLTYPNHIFVIDQYAANTLIESGLIPNTNIVISGNPAIEAFQSGADRAETDSLKVIFVSEPYLSKNPESTINEFIIVRMLISTARISRKKIDITIILHPREADSKYDKLTQEENMNIDIIRRNRFSGPFEFQYFVGLRSIFMYEAYLSGNNCIIFKDPRREIPQSIANLTEIDFVENMFGLQSLLLGPTDRRRKRQNSLIQHHTVKHFIGKLNEIFK